MTNEEAKEKAYNLLESTNGHRQNEFVLLLTKKYGESDEFWQEIVDYLIGTGRICYGHGIHIIKDTLNMPETLLFTDTHPTKCVETI
jgi:hypothetical protein